MLTKKSKYMSNNYRDAIYKKYNVLDHYEFKEFDSDWFALENHLKTIKKDVYCPTDRYIVEHQDTDYYLINEFSYGFGLYNLINVFKNLDIPLYTLLLFTNHYGISNEIHKLATDPNDCPTVIETFITRAHYQNTYQDLDVDPDLIEFPAVCLMAGTKRVHRYGLFRFFQDYKLLDRVLASI